MQPPEYRRNYSNSKTLNRMNYIDRCGHDYGDPDDVQWLKEDFVDMPLTDEQMHIFNQSYNPDWDCRYYPIKHGTFHYLVRSGHWVSKFKYEKNADGLYHMTEYYSSAAHPQSFLSLHEIFHVGYFRPPLISFEDFKARYIQSISQLKRLR